MEADLLLLKIAIGYNFYHVDRCTNVGAYVTDKNHLWIHLTFLCGPWFLPFLRKMTRMKRMPLGGKTTYSLQSQPLPGSHNEIHNEIPKYRSTNMHVYLKSHSYTCSGHFVSLCTGISLCMVMAKSNPIYVREWHLTGRGSSWGIKSPVVVLSFGFRHS